MQHHPVRFSSGSARRWPAGVVLALALAFAGLVGSPVSAQTAPEFTLTGSSQIAGEAAAWSVTFEASGPTSLTTGEYLGITFPQGFVIPDDPGVALGAGFEGTATVAEVVGTHVRIVFGGCPPGDPCLPPATAGRLTLGANEPLTNPPAGTYTARAWTSDEPPPPTREQPDPPPRQSAPFTIAAGAGGANQPPNAVADTVTTVSGETVSVFVLDNDTDPEHDAMLVIGVSQPGHGTAAIGARGTPFYAPAPGFAGTDSFTYTVVDSAGNQSTGLVEVTVLAAFERDCDFYRGTTTCIEAARSITAEQREVVSGCLAGVEGVPGRRTAVFSDRSLVIEESTVLSRGRRGPVYATATATSRELLESRLLMSRCEAI